MELWIRSQDRETLLLINTCYLYQEDTKKIVGAGVDIRTNLILGTYKSKERALEVLDEIQKAMAKTLDCIIDQMDNCIVGCNTLVLYEMPED